MKFDVSPTEFLSLMGEDVSKKLISDLEHALMTLAGSEGLLKKVDSEINDKVRKLVAESMTSALIIKKHAQTGFDIEGWASKILVEGIKGKVDKVNMKSIAQEAAEKEVRYIMETEILPQVRQIIQAQVDTTIKTIISDEYKFLMLEHLKDDTLRKTIRETLKNML